MGYLKNITQQSNFDNLGGIINLQVARKQDVAFIPEPVLGIVYGDIIFNAGAGFVSWASVLETGRAKSEGKTSREGPVKGNRINFIIPKDRADIRSMLDQAEEDEFIVVFIDSSGRQKIFGLLNSPVQFVFSHDGGGKFADGNYYECQFYFDGPDNLYFYEGEVATPPPGTAPAIVRVNGVVVASLSPGDSINFDTDFSFDFAIVGT